MSQIKWPLWCIGLDLDYRIDMNFLYIFLPPLKENASLLMRLDFVSP